jgi:hypothetical protein
MEEELKEECRASGYLLCYNDTMKRLLEMVTDKNRELFTEFADRLKHDLEVRKQTQYLPNNDFFK